MIILGRNVDTLLCEEIVVNFKFLTYVALIFLFFNNVDKQNEDFFGYIGARKEFCGGEVI